MKSAAAITVGTKVLTQVAKASDLICYIDPERCYGCGECEPMCPIECIIQEDDHYKNDKPDECTGCEACYEQCYWQDDALKMVEP